MWGIQHSKVSADSVDFGELCIVLVESLACCYRILWKWTHYALCMGYLSMRINSVHNYVRLCRCPFKTTRESKWSLGLFTLKSAAEVTGCFLGQTHKEVKPMKEKRKLYIDLHFDKCTRLWCLLSIFLFKCCQGLYARRDPARHDAMPLHPSGHLWGQTAAVSIVPLSVSLKWVAGLPN